MKLTGTNRPITYTTQTHNCLRPLCGSRTTTRCSRNKTQLNNNTTIVVTTKSSHPRTPCVRRGSGNRVTAVIAWGKRPVPFRTRKLRPTAPMVLHPGGCGRVRTPPDNHSRSRPRHHMSGPDPFKTHHNPRPHIHGRRRTLAHISTVVGGPSLTYVPEIPNPRSPIHGCRRTPAHTCARFHQRPLTYVAEIPNPRSPINGRGQTPAHISTVVGGRPLTHAPVSTNARSHINGRGQTPADICGRNPEPPLTYPRLWADPAHRCAGPAPAPTGRQQTSRSVRPKPGTGERASPGNPAQVSGRPAGTRHR